MGDDFSILCQKLAKNAGDNEEAICANLQHLLNIPESSAAATTSEAVQRAAFYLEALTTTAAVAAEKKYGHGSNSKKKKKKHAKELRRLRHLLTEERADLANQLAHMADDASSTLVAAHLLLLQVDPTAHVLSFDDFRASSAGQQTLQPAVFVEWMKAQNAWQTDKASASVNDAPLEALVETVARHITTRGTPPCQAAAASTTAAWTPPLTDPVLSIPGCNVQAAWQDYRAAKAVSDAPVAAHLAHTMATVLRAFHTSTALTEREVPDAQLRALTNKYFVDADYPAVKRRYAVPWAVLLAASQRALPFALGHTQAAVFAAARARNEERLLQEVLPQVLETVFETKQNFQLTAPKEEDLAFPRKTLTLLCSSILMEQALPRAHA